MRMRPQRLHIRHLTSFGCSGKDKALATYAAGLVGISDKAGRTSTISDSGPDAKTGITAGSLSMQHLAAPHTSGDQHMPLTALAAPGATLLDPKDHTLIMIDHQSQMAFATKSIDMVVLRNNAALVAKAAKEFGVATILTTVAEKTFSAPMFAEIKSVFPKQDAIDRTSMNTWEDARIAVRVNELAKSRIVLAGLWTSVCIVGPALSAIDQGFEVYVIADACGDISTEAHDRAMDRMVQAGARPMTAVQYLLELQRDWARTETYNQTVRTAIEHGGGYGLGLIYAKTMFGGSEGD
jgi:nicotinamidase-related amidase